MVVGAYPKDALRILRLHRDLEQSELIRRGSVRFGLHRPKLVTSLWSRGVAPWSVSTAARIGETTVQL